MFILINYNNKNKCKHSTSYISPDFPYFVLTNTKKYLETKPIFAAVNYFFFLM